MFMLPYAWLAQCSLSSGGNNMKLKTTAEDRARFIRFAAVGLLNGLVTYLIYAGCCALLGENYYQLSLFLGWTFSAIPSYITQKIWVFKTKGNYIPEFLKCCGTWAINYLLNAALLALFVRLWDNVYLTQILVLTITGIFTYFMFKLVAFKK